MIKVLMSSTTPIMRDGITAVILNLYKNINREQYKIDFAFINKPEKNIASQIIKNGDKIYIADRNIRHPIRYVKQFSRMCKGYDIVHVHGNSATMVLEMLAAFIAGVKVRIAHSHNTYCVVKIIDKVFRYPFYKLCNCRLACGKLAGQWLFRHRSFSIINNGIDTEKYRFNKLNREEAREKLGWTQNKVIGHVGNFLTAKNHEFILDVFYNIQKKDDSYRLLLIGDGELKIKIQEKAKRLNLSDKICFMGTINNVEYYLNSIDLILMPSINEGLPLTLIEEQANGLPCIVSENITKDVNLTGNVEFLSLKSDIKTWEKEIDKKIEVFGGTNRNVVSNMAIEEIVKKHYDIKKSVSDLEHIYSREVLKNE